MPWDSGTKNNNSDTSLYQWEQYPQQMYQQSYGIPEMGANPYQKWQAAQFAPMYAAWNIESMLHPESNAFAGPEGFRDYIGYYNPSSAREKLGGYYWSAMDRGPQFQYQMLDALGRDVFDQMLYGRLLGSYAPTVAAYYANQRPAIEQAWNVSPQMIGGGNWMKYLLGRVGL